MCFSTDTHARRSKEKSAIVKKITSAGLDILDAFLASHHRYVPLSRRQAPRLRMRLPCGDDVKIVLYGTGSLKYYTKINI